MVLPTPFRLDLATVSCLLTLLLSHQDSSRLQDRRVGRNCLSLTASGIGYCQLSGAAVRLCHNLQQAGYDVQYREFNGSHTVPAAIVSQALSWFVGEQPALED